MDGRTRFVVYGSQTDPLGEYDDGGAALREYVYVGTRRLALVDHDRDDRGALYPAGREVNENAKPFARNSTSHPITQTLMARRVLV